MTIAAFATGIILLSLGTIYLEASDQAFRMAAFRSREARVKAALDAGLAEGVARLEKDRAGRVELNLDREGVSVNVVSTPAAAGGVTLAVTAALGERTDRIVRSLAADVDTTAATAALRILRVRRGT